MRSRFESAFLVVVAALLGAGGVLWWLDWSAAALVWGAATAVAAVPALVWAAADLRAGRFGADLLAVLALVGTLVVGEYLAGAVVAVMLGTGRALDAYAQRRARRDLNALLERAPRQARLRTDEGVRVVPVEEVRPDDDVVVGPGEIVPVDASLLGDAVFDESALTGEPVPVERARGERVRSGVVVAGGSVDLRAVATAEDSTYAGVLRLAEQAAVGSAEVVRVADRVATVFLPVALAVAAIAALVAQDLTRAVAVLVTATPCPLLLAVPVAITAGMSRAARSGVVVRDGRALESLGHARTVLLDKTGTVTEGHPVVVEVVPAPGWDSQRVLDAAAAVEQLSTHVLADAVVVAASAAGRHPVAAERVEERAGWGVRGEVGGAEVFVGKVAELPGWARAVASRAALDAATVTWVTVDGDVVGGLLVRDRIRRDAARTVRRLRAAGLGRVVMLTGDRPDVAQDVAGLLGFDDVVANCSPADKVARVRSEPGVVVMVGDGINDAPAVAAADVGVALGSRSSTAAAQAADAVILDDRIDRLADAVEIAARARRIATQSAVTGMGLALVAMAFAAVGLLPPVLGAVTQEAIDAAVILNALRVLLPSHRLRVRPSTEALLRRFDAEHDDLRTVLHAVRSAGDDLRAGTTPAALGSARHAYDLVTRVLLPHERAEEHELYPALSAEFGGPDSTAPMSRGHAEIERLTRRVGRHLAVPGGPGPDQVEDLRATLYGLHAVLRLHFAQEEENYFVLAEHTRAAGSRGEKG